MAGLLDFFSGGSDADLYGGLLSEQQRSALATRGLAAMAEKFGQLAMPQRAPIPLGAILGQGFGAYGAGTDEAVKTAFEAQYKGAQAQKLQSEIEYAKALAPQVAKLGDVFDILNRGGGLGGAMPGSGSSGGAGALTPGGALTGNPGSLAMAEPPEVQEAVAHKLATTSGIQHWASFNPKLYNALQSAGLPTSGPLTEAQWQQANPLIKQYESGGGQNIPNYRFDAGHTAGGTHQITNSTWNSIGGPAIAASMRGNAAPSAAAPAPAGGGGLLNLPQVPQFSRDVFGGGPLATEPAPAAPNRVGRFAGVAPGTPVNSRGFPYNPEITDPAVAARVAQSMAAIKQAQQSGVPWAAPRETSGSSAAAPAAQDIYAGVDHPINSVTSADLAGGGEPSGMVSGLLAPGGPGGVPNMPAMPAAPTPANDPGLQLGPLAPAPAAAAPAAAPAAAGPGLLAPQGAAPAAALPQVNPAYGNVLAQIARLRAQSELAGIKNDPFAAFASALKDSPAYQAQIELAKRLGVFPLIGPETTAKKAAEEPFDIRASERALGNSLTEKGWRMVNGQAQLIPGYDTVQQAINLAQAAGKGLGELPTNLIIKGVENQNAIRQAAAANGTNVTFDQDGKVTFSPAPGAKEAAAGQAGAVTGAQERAKADVAAGTAPGIAGQTKYAEGVATQDTAARAQAVAARNSLYLLDDARQQLEGAGIFTGAAANLKTTAAQALAAAGFPSDKLVNTQTYLQQAGARAAEILRSGAYGTGSGVSSNDLRAADKLANGDNTVELGTIKRILDLTEKTARRNIDMFNDSMKTRAPETMIQHPPRFLGYTNKGGRLYQMPDGSQAVRE